MNKNLRLCLATNLVWICVFYMAIYRFGLRSLAEDPPSSMIPSSGHVESYLISMSETKYKQFLTRNHDELDVVWVYGEDGYQQKALDTFAAIAKLDPLQASDFDRSNKAQRGAYQSPHAVGCYLSHWKIIDMLHHRHPALRPEAYIIFEDDASCVPHLTSKVLRVVRQLPDDWDMLFISGKPITYYPDEAKQFTENLSIDQVVEMSCQGKFGVGSSPLAPDGSRYLESSQPYWRIRYIANTHAYVLNPKKLDDLHSYLKPSIYWPIDMWLAEAMVKGTLKVYMTTTRLCDGEFRESKMMEPEPWKGWWMFRQGKNVYPKRMMQPIGLERCGY